MRQLNPPYARDWATRRPSLAVTLFAVVVLPLLAATALTGWYSVRYLESQTEARMQKDIELVARAIRLPVSHALERGYERTVQQALESAFSIDRVYGVLVYDSEGREVAASGRMNASLASERVALLADSGERQGEFGEVGGEEVYSYFVPLTDAGGRISGLLQVTRKGSDFDGYIQQVRIHTLTVMTLTGVMLVLILVVGHRWAVGRHMRRIEDDLRRVGEGEREHRLTLHGAREFRLLASSVNRMLDAIERSRTELQALGERLHRAEKMAALGQLAGGVAHELGSPLSTVDGKAQRLLRREDLPEPVVTALQAIRREAARMQRIIRQLLDFGRSNPPRRRRTAADRPLCSVLETVRDQGLAREVDLRLESQGEAPFIGVDVIRLEQALGNLVRNALQAARSEVRVGWVVDDGWLSYRIDDDGPGVAPEVRGHLFEPFFTTKPVGDGTGLGLAVAHAAAHDHGGEITLDRSPLGGARFCLRLPLEPKHAGDTDAV